MCNDDRYLQIATLRCHNYLTFSFCDRTVDLKTREFHNRGEESVSENLLRVRINRSTGELELEGNEAQVTAWWERLWPQLLEAQPATAPAAVLPRPVANQSNGLDVPEIFGEYFTEFRS